MNWWVALGQAGVIGAILALITVIINTFLSPKSKAETKALAASTARQETEGRVKDLREWVSDAKEAATEAEAKAEKMAARVEALEHRESTLSRQLADCRAEGKAAREQNRLLVAHLKRSDEWMQRRWDPVAEADDPPPRFMPFAS